MAYYCEVTGVDRAPHGSVTVKWMLVDDVDPDTVITRGTSGFQLVREDDPENDEVRSAKETRLRAQLNAEFDRIIKAAQAADKDVTVLDSRMTGYRYPAK